MSWRSPKNPTPPRQRVTHGDAVTILAMLAEHDQHCVECSWRRLVEPRVDLTEESRRAA